MSGPSVAEPEVITEPPVDPAAEMRSGYDDEVESASPAPEPTPEPAKSPAPTPSPVTPEPAPAPVETAPSTLTSQQISDILAGVAKIHEIESSFGKKYDQTASQMGRLQKMITANTTTTPSGRPLPISEEDFKELKKEFPELSTPLLKELIPALQKLVPAGESMEERATREAEQMSALREAIAMDQLTDQREDWEEVVGHKDSNTPFRQWLAVQPLEYQQKVRTTTRPGVLLRAIEKFEEFQHATAPPAAPAEPAEPASEKKPAADRKARLTAAIAPQGKPTSVGGGTKTAAEEMREGYNSE